MKVYIANISGVSFQNACLCRLDKARLEKLKRLKQTEDKKRCLTAGLLIDDFVLRHQEQKILQGAYGKPYVEGGPCFSISHSGEYVLLAVDNCSVGCDVEKLAEKNFTGLAKRVFHKNEQTLLEKARDQQRCFYTLWTKKEAFLKATGEGFTRKSSLVDLSREIPYAEKGKKYYFKKYVVPGYIITVCSESKNFPEQLISVKYAESEIF